MYRWKTTLAAAALLALGAAGCSEDATGPQQTADLDVVAVDDYALTWGSGGHGGCATGPGSCFGQAAGGSRSALGTLVQEAYQKLVAEQGQEAADAALATLWQLHQEALALRGGDRATFLAALEAAHRESARLVIEVLGTEVVGTVMASASDALAALAERLAALPAGSLEAARLQRVADRATAFYTGAEAALGEGDVAEALELASRALQAATVGGGQNMRRGMGGSGRGGMQYRGGR